MYNNQNNEDKMVKVEILKLYLETLKFEKELGESSNARLDDKADDILRQLRAIL